MKYKRGSIVEVFCDNSWRCAKIVSGNRHTYTVCYNVFPGFTNKDDVERISVKSIRPCPPLLEISECWVPGNVAEVFHNLSWKMAIVLKDFGLDQFLVRLVGSLLEFELNKSELRVRQSYLNGEWIVIGKVPRDYKDANYAKDTKGDFYTKDLCFNMGSRIISSKTLKRASQGETDEDCAWKFRRSEKEGRRARVPATLPENLDAVADRKKNINRTYGYESSSGSCSINSYKPYEINHGSGFVKDIEDHESDAESVCQFGYHEESRNQETDESAASEVVPDEIRRLELHAYGCTMAALHASGPLTWEKETMGQSTDLYSVLLHQ